MKNFYNSEESSPAIRLKKQEQSSYSPCATWDGDLDRPDGSHCS